MCVGETRENCETQKPTCSLTPHSHVQYLVAQDQDPTIPTLDDEIIKKMFKEFTLSLPALDPNSPPVYESALPDMFDFGKLLKVCYQALAMKKLS